MAKDYRKMSLFNVCPLIIIILAIKNKFDGLQIECLLHNYDVLIKSGTQCYGLATPRKHL